MAHTFLFIAHPNSVDSGLLHNLQYSYSVNAYFAIQLIHFISEPVILEFSSIIIVQGLQP